MSYPDEMLTILRNEYGIHNMTEFREALRKQSRLDISLFVKPLQEERGNRNGRKSRVSDVQGTENEEQSVS